MWRKSTSIERVVDIHCHILPALDDGSQSMRETIEMLRIAADSGITDIVATPHFKAGRHNASPNTIRRRIQEVQQMAGQCGIDISLYPGNEIFYFSDIEEAIEEKRICTMNDSEYVLIEFLPSESFRTIRNAMDHVMGLGYLPILAHVERYGCILEDWKNAEYIRSMGVEIQVNASSVTGKLGLKVRKFVCQLLDRELVDYIGTDAHSSKSRTPDVQKCCRELCKRYDSSYVDKILRGNAMKLIAPHEM